MPTEVIEEIYGAEETPLNQQITKETKNRSFTRNSAGFPEVYGFQPILGQDIDRITKKTGTEQTKPNDRGTLLLQLIDDLLVGSTIGAERAHILISYKQIR